ncbi:MAG TPA: methyltransferase domain-containing protein [Acidobacteriaceae bacterium]|jgi:ubiquinone/menaquinone biosynthesis C-methylase UbiE|nr:methyltransferase domain-containing protein [Acidobacteriaceae bacterium]
MQARQLAGEYSLATGEAAVRRLTALHRVYSPTGRRVLLRAGLKTGMAVADLGCGVGATTRMLAEMVGPTGHVTGIDLSAAQLEQGRRLCKTGGITNATFVEASATATGLRRSSLDLVYCRFLLLHLVDPEAGLREMLAILKPGGVLVVEDGDLTTAGSSPASSLSSFADLFGRLGPTRGLDYSLATHLYHLVKKAGCPEADIEIHQPAMARGEDRFLLKWTVEEAAPAFIAAGLVTAAHMDTILADMDRDTRNPDILVIGPRISSVWARKPD